MTKKIAKTGAREKKLQLKKETIQDLSSLKAKAGAVKGGACKTRTCIGSA